MLLDKIPPYYKRRRDNLMKGRSTDTFIIPAYNETIRNSDVHHRFRQESSFHYFTGFGEPDGFLVLSPSSGPGYLSTLFVREKDAVAELWMGERYGPAGTKKTFDVDQAYPHAEFDKKLPELLKGTERVYYRMGISTANDARVLKALEDHRRVHGRSGRGVLPVFDPTEIMGELRLFKAPEEIELHRQAAAASVKAHLAAMKEVRPGMTEVEVEALLEYVMKQNGCQRVAYGTIVGTGPNATCLHYEPDSRVKLKDGDLLLIDAGGEVDYYAADITRTFPVSKTFTQAQAQIYDLVLKVQKETVAMVKPGVKYHDLHTHVCQAMTEGLVQLGCLKGDPAELVKKEGYKSFFPHLTGHWLGLDVHDLGLYRMDGESRKLEPGMIFTIEPGLYFQLNDKNSPEQYRGIGVRIEDDILVTVDGAEVLTAGVPKERAGIEKLRG